MAGLKRERVFAIEVPAIHVLPAISRKTSMPATRAGMTI
jgi:hypothetical protein